jgi:hypothetical protein|tara:strand:+ start:387 stop:605 length:219 start_codon:yes stop_codon:yes gene_type:complete
MTDFKEGNAIPLQMYIKATADLECDVEKDLEAKDPDGDKAKAILSGEANESTKGNDGRTSSSDDTESSVPNG